MPYLNYKYSDENLFKQFKKYDPTANDESINKMIKVYQKKYGNQYYIDDEELKIEYIQKYKKDPPENFTNNLSWRTSKMYKNKGDIDYSVGMVWYFIGLLGSLLFKEWYDGWILCTIILIIYIKNKHEKYDEGFKWTRNINI